MLWFLRVNLPSPCGLATGKWGLPSANGIAAGPGSSDPLGAFCDPSRVGDAKHRDSGGVASLDPRLLSGTPVRGCASPSSPQKRSHSPERQSLMA